LNNYFLLKNASGDARIFTFLATVTEDEHAWLLLSELRVLLAQHVEHFRMVAANKLAGRRLLSSYVQIQTGKKTSHHSKLQAVQN
jgi:hypothetical protein